MKGGRQKMTQQHTNNHAEKDTNRLITCLLYTSDAADEL